MPVTNRATGRMAIGVAVSDSPTGPFRDALGRPLVENGEIDPTVFIDDDGQAYLYWGNPNLWYVRLNADMISYSGSADPDPAHHRGVRHPHRRRQPADAVRGGALGLQAQRPVLHACSRPSAARSSSPTPRRPARPDRGPTAGRSCPRRAAASPTTPGIIDFKGGSYFFYHNGALPGGGGYTRSVAVEKFTYNADGTIPTINMTTTGAPQVGTLNPYVRQEAETIAWESGVETEPASEGGMNVGWIENGDYIKVKGVAFGAGASSFTARVASGDQRRHRSSCAWTAPAARSWARCAVPGTGGWQTWTTVTCPVSGATGTHDLYLRFTGGSGYLFNVNWWQFQNASGPMPTPTPTPTVMPTPTGPGGLSCGVTNEVVNTWQGGFEGRLTITNGSVPVTGWRVSFPFPSGRYGVADLERHLQPAGQPGDRHQRQLQRPARRRRNHHRRLHQRHHRQQPTADQPDLHPT